MRRSAVIILCFIFVSTVVQGQRTNYGLIKGVIIDSLNHRLIESASIIVYLSSDSSLVNYALSNRKGTFTIADVPLNEKCNLVITTTGYDDFSVSFILSPQKKEKRFDTIRLMKAYNELKAVTITAPRPGMAVKQDTLEFNASSFNTLPNAMVEDLLRKLPGVEVDNDGNIIINGKKVTRIILDGREFFGGDPKIAIKNLPMDIIDKLQVVHNKSREALFNNSTSGDEDLAINLTLKKEAKKGWFGRASAGYGSSERYEGSAMANFFNGQKQLSFIGNTNNTNRGSISGSDLNMSNAGSTLNGSGGGLTRSTSGGVNFSDNSGRRLKLNGSYFYNNSHTDNFSHVRRQNIMPDTTFFYNADNGGGGDYKEHRFSLNAQYNVDTLTELYFDSYFNRNVSDGITLNKASSTSPAGQSINTSENTYSSNANGKYTTSELFFSHRFRKSGRGVTLRLNHNYNNVSSINDNVGHNDYYKDGAINSSDLINQRSVGKNSASVLSLTTTYSESINKKVTVLFRYHYNRNKSSFDKKTKRFNITTDKYDIEDSAYTNTFRNVTESHNPDVSFSFNNNNYRAAIGSGLQYLQQNNVNVSIGTLLHRYYVNLIPSANVVYNFTKSGSVSIFYDGRSQQPSLHLLQPVPDNSNPLYIQLGNPDLRPSFFHNFNIQVKKLKRSNYWFTGFNFYTTRNQVINETWFDAVGKQISQPVNINGNYSMSGNVHYSCTWKKRDATLRTNLGVNGYFNRNNSFVNKVQVSSSGYSIAQSVGLNFTYKQLLSIFPSFNVRYNKTNYSSQSTQDADFNTKTFSVSAFWNYPKWLIVENNLQCNYNSQIGPGFSKNVTMWSAAINCLFFNRQQGMLRLAVYDILKQNAGVYRSIEQNFSEDRQTQVLPRYFLLSFTYNLKKP